MAIVRDIIHGKNKFATIWGAHSPSWLAARVVAKQILRCGLFLRPYSVFCRYHIINLVITQVFFNIFLTAAGFFCFFVEYFLKRAFPELSSLYDRGCFLRKEQPLLFTEPRKTGFWSRFLFPGLTKVSFGISWTAEIGRFLPFYLL